MLLFFSFQVPRNQGDTADNEIEETEDQRGEQMEAEEATGAPANQPQPSTSTLAKVYDPEHCKKMRKLSSAQMQEKEIKMREERQNELLETMRGIRSSVNPNSAQENDVEGDTEFTQMIGKQLRLVVALKPCFLKYICKF